MHTHGTTLLIVATTALSLSTAAQAEGFYGTGMLGWGVQATDSEPYGNNIAADPDFPGEFNSGDGVAAALGAGYDFGNQFRVEGRLGFHKGEFDSQEFGSGARAGQEYVLNGDIESTTVTVEGFYDIPTAMPFTPYIKAGAGVAHNTYSARLGGAGVAAFDPFDGTVDGYYDAYDDETSTNFSWNIGFGGSMPIAEGVSVFGEYQFVSLGEASTGQDAFTDGFRVDASVHEVLFGLRADF